VIARRAAGPAIERLAGRRVAVAGANRHAAYLDLDGFVIVLTTARPLLPNAVEVAELPAVGTEVVVRFDRAETWDAALRLGDDPASRGAEILRALGVEAGELAGAVRARDPALAAAAGARLIGRGSGLTPENDDLVAGTAAVVAAGRWPDEEREAWLCALLGHDLRARTTALSATLLELAARGQIAEPVHGLFGPEWRDALARLRRLGHSTGPAYARAAASAARELG
jgi:uncharacterized protein DUF2877